MLKIDKLRAVLKQKGLDAILVTNPYNRQYISNFTGSAGNVLITAEQALLITDFRYIEQATDQAKHFKIVQHNGPIVGEINSQLEKYNVKTLAFEQTYVTFKTFQEYEGGFNVELVPTERIIENLRLIKSNEEIKIMSDAAKIADDAFNHVLNFIKPGVKEIDISNELEMFMRKAGATSSSFDTIVASGYRGALPHGVASNKEMQSGELVTMDFGALYNGYCSDMTRTVAIGEINSDLREIYDIVLQAQLKGVAGIKAGITGAEADALTRDVITSKGFGKYFGHSTGHGVGLEVHEEPSLSSISEAVLKENMVVTVEPGIYIPDLGGCRIEDDIVVTKDGNIRLTQSLKELITL